MTDIFQIIFPPHICKASPQIHSKHKNIPSDQFWQTNSMVFICITMDQILSTVKKTPKPNRFVGSLNFVLPQKRKETLAKNQILKFIGEK